MTSTQNRTRMVEEQLVRRGISDLRVLDAFRAVPREAFLSHSLIEFAYQDSPLPIEEGQTISQPYIVALMAQALGLRGHERILEVGTGSGYAAAILSHLGKDVFSVERHAVLAADARERLAALGCQNVHVLHGDGTLGWPEHAPYDAIVVAAGGPEVPQALLAQLSSSGRLVIPVGEEESSQTLLRVTREGPANFREEAIAEVRFVPLIGEQGWVKSDGGFRAPGDTSRRSSVASHSRHGHLFSNGSETPTWQLVEARRSSRGARGRQD